MDVRRSNIMAAKAVADVVKTSLGPKGMDKMIQSGSKGQDIIITNDGATILKQMSIVHPCARMVFTSKNQQFNLFLDGSFFVFLFGGVVGEFERGAGCGGWGRDDKCGSFGGSLVECS